MTTVTADLAPRIVEEEGRIARISQTFLGLLVLAFAVTHAVETFAGPADRAVLEERTMAWVSGWRTSPDEPFNLDAFSHIYARDDTFSSLDFGRPHHGFSDWDTAAAYYWEFMAVPETWRLTPGDDLNVTIRDNVAWTTLSLSGRGTMADGSVLDMPEARVTLIFERRGDEWLIVHEHGSSALPFPDEQTTREILERIGRE